MGFKIAPGHILKINLTAMSPISRKILTTKIKKIKLFKYQSEKAKK